MELPRRGAPTPLRLSPTPQPASPDDAALLGVHAAVSAAGKAHELSATYAVRARQRSRSHDSR